MVDPLCPELQSRSVIVDPYYALGGLVLVMAECHDKVSCTVKK